MPTMGLQKDTGYEFYNMFSENMEHFNLKFKKKMFIGTHSSVP